VAGGTFVLERMLRRMLPAPGPPAKGYLAHVKELEGGAGGEEEARGVGGGARGETKKRR